MASDQAPTVTNAASGPASVQTAVATVTQQPLDGLIHADQYASAKQARRNKLRGVAFSKLLAAGAFPDQGGTRQGGTFRNFDGGF